MPDKINDLIKQYKFDKLINEKRKEIPQIFKIVMKAYELFYGEEDSVPSEIIKAFIKEILKISPNYIHLITVESREVVDRVIDRVVEQIYGLGSTCLVDTKEIKYVK